MGIGNKLSYGDNLEILRVRRKIENGSIEYARLRASAGSTPRQESLCRTAILTCASLYPPTFITGASGGTGDGTDIMVRNKDIRSKFFCDIVSSPAI